MTGVRAVVFDWAGTMVDFGSRAPVMAMMAAFAEGGTPVTEVAVRRYMGYAKRDHVAALLREPELARAWAAVRGRAATEADIDALVAALEPVMAAKATECGALIPGAADTASWLAGRGVRIGSTTGYTRTMMQGVLPVAAAAGYAPDAVVCAGETAAGRPAPFMIWRALESLGVWPTDACVVVDDAPVGIEAGVGAGAWTVGVAGSGNGVGLAHDAFAALDPQARARAMAPAAEALARGGADFVIESVADLPAVIVRIEERMAQGQAPGSAPTQSLI